MVAGNMVHGAHTPAGKMACEGICGSLQQQDFRG